MTLSDQLFCLGIEMGLIARFIHHIIAVKLLNGYYITYENTKDGWPITGCFTS